MLVCYHSVEEVQSLGLQFLMFEDNACFICLSLKELLNEAAYVILFHFLE